MKRCIMVMFDSLNRHMLPPYNAEAWIKAPHFQRLAERCTTFDTSYVCSMPCMPARRDFHTGRPNFLHTNWGPLEPFDDSVPAILRDNDIYSHLATDHYHYFEHGGATYHTSYSSWEFFRGQEGDPWTGMVGKSPKPEKILGKQRESDWANRTRFKTDADYPQSKTFAAGLEFIERNRDEDQWFLQIECFDPHEPFTTDPQWQTLYPSPDIDAHFDWPNYSRVKETPEQAQVAKNHYASLVSKCDDSLGKIMDAMDAYDMWQDTMLIVWTDHGFLLGEHNHWAKNWPLLWEEYAHTPFFVWDPRQPDSAGQRRSSLVQPSIDLGPTLLGYFGLPTTDHMIGKDLAGVIESDAPVRDAGIFGYHGARTCITDGRYTYFSSQNPEAGLHAYTLMPTAMRTYKDFDEDVSLVPPFSFTKGLPTLKLKIDQKHLQSDFGLGSYLFDLQTDPGQASPLDDPETEERLKKRMAELMHACDAPEEQFVRVGLDDYVSASCHCG